MSEHSSSLDRYLHQELTLEIEKMAITGEGVGRYEGAVVFVPFSAPQDKLKVKIVQVKKNFLRAEIINILNPSPIRRNPPCPIFGSCGGCSWQHLAASFQLEEKQRLLSEILKKFLPETSLPFLEPVASPKEFFYRNRIQPRLRSDSLGFFSTKSHDWVAAKDCFLVEEPLREFFQTPPRAKSEKIELYLDTTGQPHYREILDEIEDQLFSQVNRFQNEDLIHAVLNWTKGLNPSVIFDFYAGAGNFSFPLSDQFKNKSVTAVELNPALVQIARSECLSRRISPKNLEFYALSVDHYLKRTPLPENSLVILDPPRQGCSEYVIRSLAADGCSKKIIFISCHPVSLGRDLQRLQQYCASNSLSLSINKVQLFEMFPQTSHFETIAEVTLKSVQD